MPKEVIGFLLVIIGLVGIVVLFGLWTRRKEDEEAAENDFADDPFDDFEDKTFDPYNGKEVVIFDKSKPESNLDVEIARKTAELARLQYEIDQAKQQNPAPQPQPKKKKKHGCLSTISCVCFMVVVFALIGGNSNDTTSTKSTYTARPQTTAVIKQNTVSPSIIKTAVSNALEKLDLFDYFSVSCDETAVTIYVGFNDVAEDLAQMKANGENENNKDWMTIKDSLMTVYNQVVGALADYGYTKNNCMLNFINTKNHDNILLMIYGGSIVYDCMK